MIGPKHLPQPDVQDISCGPCRGELDEEHLRMSIAAVRLGGHAPNFAVTTNRPGREDRTVLHKTMYVNRIHSIGNDKADHKTSLAPGR